MNHPASGKPPYSVGLYRWPHRRRLLARICAFGPQLRVIFIKTQPRVPTILALWRLCNLNYSPHHCLSMHSSTFMPSLRTWLQTNNVSTQQRVCSPSRLKRYLLSSSNLHHLIRPYRDRSFSLAAFSQFSTCVSFTDKPVCSSRYVRIISA